MSEGTKIGEFKENNEFNTAVRTQNEPQQDLTATKYGQMSEFEKSLYSDSEVENKEPENKGTEENSLDSETPQKQQEEVNAVENTGSVETTEKEEAVAVKEEANISVNQDEVSFEQDFQQQVEKSLVDIQEGDLVKGIIRSVEKSGILVDISYKSDGFLSNSEVQDDKAYNAGDEILVIIEKLESREGYAVLSRKKALIEEAWNEIVTASKTKDSLTVKVESKVQGGLVVSFKGIRGFIPASQVLKDKQAELENFVNESLNVIVLQADRKRRKVIYSHKLARSKAENEKSASLIESLDIGDICEGKVTSIKDFGVFVDIGGVEGLVHISELSWSRVSHPSEFVNVGDSVRVFVLGVDKENRKISLGIKQLSPDPWVEISKKYHVGQVIEGTIARIVPFGAFINVEDRLEGLIHISEMSKNHIEKVEDVIKEGDVVKARIIKLIPEEQKIGLSLKDVEESDALVDASSQEEVVGETLVEEENVEETPTES